MANLLIVTPMHNEEENVAALAESIAAQTFREFEWWAVDDGSSDGTLTGLQSLADQGRLKFVTKRNDGGLIGGSAYTSWRFGVLSALASPRETPITHVMKLDADVRMASDYLQLVMESFQDSSVRLAGGVITSPGMREQKFHVPGPVKLYTIGAFRALDELPSAIGFDVMDEVVVQKNGGRVVVVPHANFGLARAIGASEGGLHGRYRNGRVCRWTGYYFPYFLLHTARYVIRRPYVFGSFWMLAGYMGAGESPYDRALRVAHRDIQRAKLRDAIRNPMDWFRRAYGRELSQKDAKS